MKYLQLSACALSVLAGAGLAACSANIKPNTVTFANSQASTASTQTAATNTPAPAEASAPPANTASVPASAATETAPASSSETSAVSASLAVAASAPSASSTASAATTAAPAPAATPISMPTRGMLMSQVERQFGSPGEKIPAVPDPGTKVHPPITRWVYPAYVVYFEYNYVVHSVLKAHPFSNPNAGTN